MIFYKPLIRAEKFKKLRPLAKFRRDLQRFINLDYEGNLEIIDLEWAYLRATYLSLNSNLARGGYYTSTELNRKDPLALYNLDLWEEPKYQQQMKQLHRGIKNYLEKRTRLQKPRETIDA
jgi:hypothetical protein